MQGDYQCVGRQTPAPPADWLQAVHSVWSDQSMERVRRTAIPSMQARTCAPLPPQPRLHSGSGFQWPRVAQAAWPWFCVTRKGKTSWQSAQQLPPLLTEAGLDDPDQPSLTLCVPDRQRGSSFSGRGAALAVLCHRGTAQEQ